MRAVVLIDVHEDWAFGSLGYVKLQYLLVLLKDVMIKTHELTASTDIHNGWFK